MKVESSQVLCRSRVAALVCESLSGVARTPLESSCRSFDRRVGDRRRSRRGTAKVNAYRHNYNHVRPHEAIAWNRPADMYAGTAYPTIPTSKSKKPCQLLDAGQSESICSAKTLADVFHPRALQGRSFSARATACRSSADHRDESVPFGKYCRSSPLVFSFVGRYQCECGSAKNRCVPVSIAKIRTESDGPSP